MVRWLVVFLLVLIGSTRAGLAAPSAIALDNSVVGPTEWSIESVSAGVYLKGARQTAQGVNKFMLICVKKDLYIVYAIFDPQGRGDEALNMPNHFLLIDDKMVSIDDSLLGPQTLEHGWINMQFALDAQRFAQLSKAHTVGILLQRARGHDAAVGFRGMDFSGGARKLPEFLRTCPLK
jgi:hypothetical protein